MHRVSHATRRTVRVAAFVLAVVFVCAPAPRAQPPFQDDFPVDELVQRRARVLDAIGNEAIAIVLARGARLP